MNKLSGDATDVLFAIVKTNRKKSDGYIFKQVKKDDFIMSEVKEMNITDKELMGYIEDAYVLTGY